MIEIDYVITKENGFIIGWSNKEYGIGELTFDGEKIDSENMGEEFCNKIFEAFVKKYLSNKFLKK